MPLSMANENTLEEVSEIVIESPIKPTYSINYIVERFENIQKYIVKRGIMKRHLLFWCAFNDILSDKEKIDVICGTFDLNYEILKRLAFDVEFYDTMDLLINGPKMTSVSDTTMSNNDMISEDDILTIEISI